MVRRALPLAASLLLSACASDAPRPPAGPAAPLRVERGSSVAEMRCAACHAIRANTDSPHTGAPTFQSIRLRFNPLSWERTMSEIAAGRHGEMPALSLDPADVRDVRAYIETLR